MMNNASSSRKPLQVIAIISAIALTSGTGAFFALGNHQLVPQAFSQQSATLSSNNPSIKVTGDATASLMPDQATLIVNVQSQPDSLTEVLESQDDKIAEVRAAVEGADNNAKVSIGYRNIYPYHSGYGTPVSDEVTFNIYATTAIRTNIDQLSSLVNALAEAGFGFESVYIDPYYSEAIMRDAGKSLGEEDEGEGSIEAGDGEEQEVVIENPITIGVNLSTQPAVLTEAIEEYEEKYRALLAVLEEQGISEDQIQNNNFNIYPVYYGSSPAAGYQASTQVIVKTSSENVDDISRAVRDVDGIFVENIVVSVSDEAIDNARKDLTAQAIENARERASEMVEALGLEIAGVKSIEAATGPGVNPYGNEMMYRGVKIVQPYYYQTVSGDIAVSVTVEFELAEARAAEED